MQETKKSRLCAVMIFAALVFAVGTGDVCPAQTNPNLENGIKPFGSYDATSIDSVNVATGALSLHIPLLSYAQRGNFPPIKYSIGFASKNFTINPHCTTTAGEETCSPHWQPTMHDGTNTPNFGVFVLADNGSPGINWTLATTLSNGQKVYQLYAASGDHSQHPLTPSPFASNFISEDGSGYVCSGCNGLNILTTDTMYTRGGIHDVASSWVATGSGYYGQVGSSATEDTNGNLENTSDTMGKSLSSTPTATDLTGCASTATSAAMIAVPGLNGSTSWIKTCSASIAISTNFQDSTYYDPAGNTSPWKLHSTVMEYGSTTTVVVTVLLWDGSGSYATPDWTTSPAWSFQYGDTYGDLTQIALPTGGTITYTWGFYSPCGDGVPGVTNMSMGVTMRTASAGSGTTPMVTTYRGGTTNDGANDTVHTFTGIGGSCALYETQTKYFSGTSASGTLLKTVNTDYTYSYDPYGSYYTAGINYVVNVLPIRTTTSLPNGHVSKVETDYLTATAAAGEVLSTGNVIQKREYDWGSTTPTRCTATTYKAQQNSAYMAANLLDLPASVSIYSGACGSGTLVSQTTYGYDESYLQSSGISTQRDTTVANPGVRGNRTSAHAWLNTTGSTVNTFTSYYDTGMPSQSVDAKGNPTIYSYSSTYAGAYLTQTQLPTTNGVNHTVQAAYDFNTGLMTSFTDQNNQVYSYTYDPLWRIATANLPDGGYASFSYPSFTTVQETTGITATLPKLVETDFDGLGRLSVTKLLSDPYGTDYTTTTYNAQGQKSQVSNPFRSTSELTYGVTSYTQYDGLGRLKAQTNSDNSTQSWNYSDNSVTQTDEAGNQWIRRTDALGRLIQVLEPNGTTQSPTMQTDYGYDALDRLTSVQQWGGPSGSSNAISRSFTYDSLSRLLSATNPETGTVGYTYDVNGNVLTKTDARNATTSYSYDPLNRMLSKTYSDGITPLACYQYDSSPGGIGRLKSAWTQSASTGSCSTSAAFLTKRWNIVYDPMGRILSEQQCTPSNCTSGSPYVPVYTYDLAGNLTSYTNGTSATPSVSTLLFTNTYDAAGRLQTVTSNWSDATHPQPLFAVPTSSSQPSYAPFGGLMNATFGNGLTLSRMYDNRFRVIYEGDTGTGSIAATRGSATVTITGVEQSQ